MTRMPAGTIRPWAAVLVCLGMLPLLGCDASLVSTRRRIRGPVAEVGVIDPGGGHARYAMKGPRWVARKRRKAAFRKMAKYCEGEGLIRIEKEYESEDVMTPFNSTDLDENKLLETGHYRVELYHHMLFHCERPGP